MRGAILCLTLWGSLLGGVVSPAGAEVTGDQVRVAIERSSAYLKRQQRPDGSWPDWPNNPGGVTALAALALLNAGVEPEDDSIQRALKHLRKLAGQESDKTKKTYVVALATMVFCKASPEKDRVPIEQNVAWLEKTQIVDGKRRGSWSYPSGSGDPSNAQFALLALHEAERIGVNVSARTWRLARAYWVDHQNADGSWGYEPGGVGTGSMTCAGIASLVITSNMVRQSNARVDGDRIRCCVQDESGEDGIRRAFQWLGSSQVFAVGHNPGRTRGWWTLYYLYALERAGRLTARRFIGEHDWYREGAERLLTMKGGETSDHWIGLGPCEGKSEQIATAFALLFLSKGRRPILLSKLKHGTDDDWNQHRSDVANLTQYVESRWKRDMTWQVVDLEKATVEDLLESPVLYLCGRTNPLPRAVAAREELARKVRDYLDGGGFLFAEAYSSGTDFDRELRDFLDRRVFPEPEYRLAPLPPQHPVWRTEEAVEAKYVRPLWGIEFGCRTSVIYSPPDASGAGRPSLSCLWELSRSGRDAEFSPEVQARIDAGKSIGINVLAYATNRELKFKDPAKPKAAGGGADDPFPRGRLYVANLRHMGGCNA
ncbi:MAG: DUF4159 domain-containing protein, partial [Planctomycetes bacterium]|nr:DUF4159 domain-containing protein [Planctomycetota bacterium]